MGPHKKSWNAFTCTQGTVQRVIFVGVNFREKPEMAFRNNFRDSNIRALATRTCAHAQRGLRGVMNSDECVCDRFSMKERGTACVRELCG